MAFGSGAGVPLRRITLNQRPVGVLWCKPFQLQIGEFLRPGKNTLEVEVSNLAANHIRDLDRRQVNWKYFYDINVVNENYRPLDASNWPLFDSGLLGPVFLQPIKKTHPLSPFNQHQHYGEFQNIK